MKPIYKAVAGFLIAVRIVFIIFQIIFVVAFFKSAYEIFTYEDTFSYVSVESENKKYRFGLIERTRIAYCEAYRWDGIGNYITIPDTFGENTVIGLGSPREYEGVGFRIEIEADEYKYDLRCGENDFNRYHEEDDEYETLLFYVHLGSNLTSIRNIDKNYFLANRIQSENGDIEYDFTYKIAFYFIVNPNNKTFYSENGKLYYQSNGGLVDEFFYE